MIQLTNRSVLLMALGAPLWLMSIQAAFIYILFVLGLHVLDILLLPRKAQLSLERVLPHHFEVDTPILIQWKASGFGALTADNVVLEDSFPNSQYRTHVASEIVEETYLPLERGLFRLAPVALILKGRLGLLYRRYLFELSDDIKVYPKARPSKDLLTSTFGKPDVNKIRDKKILQKGGEFESLRPYTYGEDLSTIEWKISAKRGELITKNWEMENDRHVSVLIDCGRKMAETVGGRSLLDYSLDGAAELSRTIQNKRDTFSLYAFSNKIEASLLKTNRKTVTKQTLETIYQLMPQPVESDYWKVVGQVMHQLNKRSLIILFSNVLDIADSQGLLNNLSRASKKHLVLCIMMKDNILTKAATEEGDIYRQGAACHLLLERKRAIKQMQMMGVNVLEASASNFITQVLQAYLNVREKI